MITNSGILESLQTSTHFWLMLWHLHIIVFFWLIDHIPFALIIPLSKRRDKISEFLSFSRQTSSNFTTFSFKSSISMSFLLISCFTSSKFSYFLFLSCLFILRFPEFLTSWWNLPLCPYTIIISQTYSKFPLFLKISFGTLEEHSCSGFFYWYIVLHFLLLLFQPFFEAHQVGACLLSEELKRQTYQHL